MVVSRTVHRSVLLALVMADLVPVWVHPELDHDTGLPLAVTPAAAAAALDGAPDACALWLTDPSYVGTCGDVAALASVAHARDVPLVVDAAWGAHFGAHPRLPAHPFALGADAVVTSFHKTLPALDQAAVVMARTDRLDPARLQRGFEAGHTTSPSGSTLASIDAARALLGRHGHRLAGELVDLADRARARLRAVPGLAVAEAHGAGGAVRFDAAKLVVLLHGTGTHGHAVERDLLARGLTLEMADRDVIIPMLTIADTTAEGRREVERMLTELTAAVERHRAAPRRPAPHAAWTVRAEQVLTPRQAFFATHEAVPWHRAAGRVSAEIVAPYPPGVPVLAPGERVTREALDALTAARDDGGRVAYAADPTLETLQVVRGYGP